MSLNSFISLEEFYDKMENDGFIIFQRFVYPHLVDKLTEDLQRAYLACRRVQSQNNLPNMEGTAHHLVGMGQSFMDLLNLFEDLDPYLRLYFNGKYVLNSLGGNLLKNGSSYANSIHRDQRSFSGEINLMLNTIVTLDDFTEENGATWLMRGGHRIEAKPSLDFFGENAVQVVAPAGSVIMFNSNLWHAAGDNHTKNLRKSLTPMFCRPFIKPQFDYPRALGYEDAGKYSPYIQQILGYNSRIPATLQEWYQPVETRFYKPNQG